MNLELGVSLLMVTHDAVSATIAERQLRLEHGKLSERSTPARAAMTRGA
jgi:predicted ABC-type transport system involved in lysophospholipase L1 biosynthesis ATPase subunit